MEKVLIEEISGSLETIVYVHPENGFTVARLKESKKKELTTIVGCLTSALPGEILSCQGNWKLHPRHGYQFEVVSFTVTTPSDCVGIQKYLESGLVRGIGPSFAKKIVERFKEKTLATIEEEPERLLEIHGLGEKKLESIKECWKQQSSIREVMLFLRAHEVSPAFAQKIYRAYGEESIQKVKENPYQLAKEVFGVGFKMADSIAQKLGFALYSPERIRAGIEFVLWELSTEGHTCFPKEDLLPLIVNALEVDSSLIETELQKLLKEEVLAQRESLLFLKSFYAYEVGIAKDLMRLKSSLQAIRPIQTEKAVEWVQERLRIRFAKEQEEAIKKALSDKVHIITGGPGTGKSTITKAILAITQKLTTHILLAAPTGRAAKRLTQITGKKAFTIHALLEMDFTARKFKRGRDNPLSCDLIIVDEASMIDTPLLFYLLRAIPSHARLLFVGDIDQLPSVGPGTVLRDTIQSGLIGVTCLKEIFRQARGSQIITNAHRINAGEIPALATPEKSDFHYVECETPEAIQQRILELVAEEIPKRWHLHPIEEIQVLSPMKRGPIGAEMLNEQLQMRLNPSSRPLLRAGRRLHVGDKVMQISNNYDKKVYNGDIGTICAIDMVEQLMTVRFDERVVEYDFTSLDELVLAYATSVHKYQGSECPCVVIPLHTSHFKLLFRNLLYTAVTRGKRLVYLVGSKKAIAIAVHNNHVQKRYTGLIAALQEAAGKKHPLSAAQLEFC